MRQRFRVSRFLLAAGMAALMPACTDSPVAPRAGRPADIAALLVSSARGLARTEPRAFLSLPEGSVPATGDAIITNRVSGVSVRRPLVNGGFDPVGIDALPGDELRIVIGGQDILRLAAALPPVIVRTDPVRRRRGVPLNSRMMLVFSEPVDPATVTATAIRLVGPAGAEDVSLALEAEGTVVSIMPRATMRPGSDYRIDVGTGIADLSGDHLPRAEAIEFSTASLDDAPPQAVRLFPDTLRVPVGASSGFIVAVDSGRTVIREYPNAELTWTSLDTAVARFEGGHHLVAVTQGRTRITVTYRGNTDTADVIVTAWPPPGPFGIWPQGAVMPIGHTTKFEVSHPEGTTPPVLTWSVSNPAIISVDGSGNVIALAAGVAWVRVSNGTTTDSADVEVYDPAPKLGQLYVIRPDSVLFQQGDVLWLAVNGPDNPPPAVTWTVANSAIATVTDRGAITAHALGRTTVTARFSDGSETVANVIVVTRGTLGNISLSPLAPTIHVGDTLRFQVTYDARAQQLWGNQGSSWSLAGGAARMVLNEAGAFVGVTPGFATVRTFAGPLWAETRITVVP